MTRRPSRLIPKQRIQRSYSARLEMLEPRRLLAADLVAQWSADDLVADHSDGQTIASWSDTISGRQASGQGNPTLRHAAWQGRATVAFDSSDSLDAFVVQAADSPIQDVDEFTAVVVFGTDSTNLTGTAAPWFANTGLLDANQQGKVADWGIALSGEAQLTAGVGLPTTTLSSKQVNLNDGQPHAAIFVQSRDELNLWVDGVRVVDVKNDHGPRTATDTYFGSLASGNNGFTGEIGEVRFYHGAMQANTALSVTEELLSTYWDRSSVNSAPLGRSDAFAIPPTTSLTQDSTNGLLTNDQDDDGDELTVRLESSPAHGQLTLNDDGSFVYLPNAGYVGQDQFRYRPYDGQQLGDPVDVWITVSPVIISEFVAMASTGLSTRTRSDVTSEFTGDPIAYDWIEVRNLTSDTVDLSETYLTDDAEAKTKWRFPAGTVLPANGILTLFASGQDIRDAQFDELGYLHTNFRLSADGESLAIFSPSSGINGTYPVDFPAQIAGTSFGYADGRQGYFSPPTPGETNVDRRDAIAEPVTFSHPAGFYENPFELTLDVDENDARIRYTLDGTEPTEENGIDYEGPLLIDGIAVLRTRAFSDSAVRSPTTTRSYLNIAAAIGQEEMDPDILQEERWMSQMESALEQIPSLSLAIDPAYLYDRRTGLLRNSSGRGKLWERPASLELMGQDDAGFQVDAGLRLRGGFSRGARKSSFRFFFRDEYGDPSLDYPLFGNDGASSFKKIDLRTAQNYSWSYLGDIHNNFLRDIFSRESQGEMDQPYTRGRYYHLYLNGEYFGIYQTEERPEADYAESYFGGDADDYDVIKSSGPLDYYIEATDGTLDAYRRLWQATVEGYASNEAYYRIQGLQPDGESIDPAADRLLDAENLMDYMIITYYTGDSDGPGSKFTRPRPNNIFGIYNRENPDGFKWFEHDSEHSLDTGQENMVFPILTEHIGFDPNNFATFNPHWLHEALIENAEYRLAFADRVHQRLSPGGVFSDEASLERLNSFADQIDVAIVAESARWGDARKRRPLTADNWVIAADRSRNWLPGRADKVIAQLREINWFPSIDGPTFSPAEEPLPDKGAIKINGTDGTLYYTRDGSDPRLIGGGINPSALVAVDGASISIEGRTQIKARALVGETWSVLSEATFGELTPASSNSLKISEVHYHPSDPTLSEANAGHTDADDFEFIELINTSSTTIDLRGVSLRQEDTGDGIEGVAFPFAQADVTELKPGDFVIVVEDRTAFEVRYGKDLPVAGQWSGGLGNGGESIFLDFADQSSHNFRYSDDWYGQTDGAGSSLEFRDPSQADLNLWSESVQWTASPLPHGTPGRIRDIIGDANRDGQFNSRDLVLVFQAGEYEDNLIQNSTWADGDWNGDNEFDSADLVTAFQNGEYESGIQPARRFEIESFDHLFAAFDFEDDLNPKNKRFRDR